MKTIEVTEAAKDEVAAAPNFRARKQQAAREIVWDAAIELFLHKGYDETTVDDVAQAAGISPRSFFRYFATKGDVMAYALIRFADQIIAVIDACPEHSSLSEVVRSTMFQISEPALKDPRARKIFEMLKRSPAADGAQMARFVEAQGMLASALIRRFPDAGLDDLTAKGPAGAMILLTGVAVRWCIEHDVPDISSAMDRLLPTMGAIFADPPKANGKQPRKH